MEPLVGCQFANLELDLYRAMLKKRAYAALLAEMCPNCQCSCLPTVSLGFCLDPPVAPCPYSYHFFGYASILQMVLFERDPALLVVYDCLNPAHPELYVEVGRFLIQDISLQQRLDFLVPDRFRVEVQVFLESPGNDYSAGKLGSKFGWYSQPSLVVELPFEIIHRDWTPLVLFPRLFFG